MKGIKNKEIIIGLIALIFLCIMAIILILKREVADDEVTTPAIEVQEIVTKEEIAHNEQVVTKEELVIKEEHAEKVTETEGAKESLQESLTDEVDNIGIKDGPLSVTKENDKTEISKGEIISNKKQNAESKSNEFHTEPKYREYTGEEMWQLEELYYYWMEYKLEAVDDLIRLPRVRMITNELKGSNDFYYYGQKDNKGNPSGSGLAVYADNTYYCGEWKNGKRHGKGMLLKIFPDKTGTINGVQGVTEHSYNGTWANDYPNGEGQEHVSYDMTVATGEYIITNVIGNFKDGYYDGELYIMTEQGENGYIDWEATAERGVFKHCSNVPDSPGRYQVWERMTLTDDEKINYRLMYDKDNMGFGIFGLKMKD